MASTFKAGDMVMRKSSKDYATVIDIAGGEDYIIQLKCDDGKVGWYPAGELQKASIARRAGRKVTSVLGRAK